MSTVDDLLDAVERTQTIAFLRRLGETPGSIPVRIIGKIEEAARNGRVIMWPKDHGWEVWFVGYHIKTDESTSNVPTNFYRAYPISGEDLSQLKLDTATIQQAILAGVSESESAKKIAKALEQIKAAEDRLLSAEDRFRDGQPDKARECARARAELMPVRAILQGK